MMNLFADITENKINVETLLDAAKSEIAGGTVIFCGTVRNNNYNKIVKFLDYEAHPTIAKKVLQNILNESIVIWPLIAAIVVHKIGRLNVGETAVVVITGSKHRKEAYAANQYIINKLKTEAPIWKKETFIDGSYIWGNHQDISDPKSGFSS